MSQIPYRANLSSAVYPLRIEDAGRSVIIPGADQNYDKRVDNSENRDAGIPQAIYMENVLPTVYGYQSVGYSNEPNPLVGTSVIRHAFEMSVQDVAGVNPIVTVYIEHLANGTILYRDEFGIQLATVPAGLILYNEFHPLSWALVRGTTYVHDSSGGRIFEAVYNSGSTSLTFNDISGTFTGLTVSQVLSICSSFNYLIAINKSAVFWSSTTTPTDFVPSLVTGAGTELISGIKAQQNFLLESDTGFFIYSDISTFSARYTGNRNYPWKFKEIAGSGGFTYPIQITRGKTLNFHVGVNNFGNLQTLNPDTADNILPEVSHYFERCFNEDVFDSITNTFSFTEWSTNTTNRRNGNLIVTISVVFDRYLILSHIIKTQENYAYALVYDFLLKRLGRLKIDHKFVLSTGDLLHFLNCKTGELWRVIFNFESDSTISLHSGVLILGKFALTRNKRITLQEIEIESIRNTNIVNPGVSTNTVQNFSLAILPSLDGKNFSTPITPYQAYNSGFLRKYYCRAEGQNISAALKGAFAVNTVQLKVTQGGNS